MNPDRDAPGRSLPLGLADEELQAVQNMGERQRWTGGKRIVVEPARAASVRL